MNYIIPTIDVEALRSLSRLGNFDQLIMGKIDDDYFGVPKILDIIREYNGSGTFYVDFAEYKHGIDKLKNLSNLILEKGSDVQLHIHPQFIADENRYLLNQYSKEEQSEIFEKCIDIQKKCTGEKPRSFRAGGYGADNNTLELLNNFGITSDSSYFHNHKWCNISKKPLNRISKNSGLIEIPVT
ncbi:MAG: polysaccharide deacetylase family protein, partial [Melioribacteraceae bacterium]